jgi:hypothetical protein
MFTLILLFRHHLLFGRHGFTKLRAGKLSRSHNDLSTTDKT